MYRTSRVRRWLLRIAAYLAGVALLAVIGLVITWAASVSGWMDYRPEGTVGTLGRVSRLQGRVALVTGASRGCGKGIAAVLGEEGATVYVTGRSVRGEPATLGRPGTIDETADEVTARGGTGIAVRCDHADDAQVRDVFARIHDESGRLDLLVNNAWSGYEIGPDPALAFWQIEWRHWDLMFSGGLRAAAYASCLAAPPMIGARHGLIVNLTWVLDRPHGHAFYEVVKTGTNKLTEQMADDLRPHEVACALSG